MNKYHYYIEDIEVFPRGEWSINYQRNEGQIFFRRIFEGELTFMGDDYDLITSLECEIATFDIYCNDELFWQGQFQHPYIGKFDDDACTLVLTPEVVDEYSCIMDKYDRVYYDRVYLPVAGAIAPTYQACPPAGVLATLPNGFNLYHHFAGAGLGTDGMINDSLYFNCGGIGVKSSFLWRDNFVNGDNYAANYNIDNYIAGSPPYAGTNRLEYIYLFPSYNVRAALSWGGTQCDVGQDGTWSWSFKDWETFLRIAFNAYWFIDENGEFRIEHHYYFDPDFPNSDYTVGHDLNTVIDRGGRSFAYRRNKYEYETGRLYDQEVWKWIHYAGTEGGVAHGVDFAGVPIFYGSSVDSKSDFVPGDFKEKELESNKFWADIVWAYGLIAAASPDTINCDGYLFCDIDLGPTNIIRCETGVLGGISIQNGHCSNANLQDHYHQYNRIFIDGNMNSGNVTTFQTAQKHKLQDPIEFPLCCDEDFDPLDRIRTGLGDGEVKAAIQKKQSLEVELWHEFDCRDLCIPIGCINWDGIDDSVSIATGVSFVNIVGSRTVELDAYLFSDTSLQTYTFICWETANVDDFFLASIDPGNRLLYVQCYSNPAAGTSRAFNIPTSDFNRCVKIEITKTASTITGASIDGVALTPNIIGQITAPTASYFGRYSLGGSPNWLKYMAIWNIKVYDTTPTLLHSWKGFPDGDQNAAWTDLIGVNNGTVNGSPAIY